MNLPHHEEFQIFTKIGYKGVEGKLEANKWYLTQSNMEVDKRRSAEHP